MTKSEYTKSDCKHPPEMWIEMIEYTVDYTKQEEYEREKLDCMLCHKTLAQQIYPKPFGTAWQKYCESRGIVIGI